jgi:hypothetical protein
MVNATCESCICIDVRHWRREGRLEPGQAFFQEWTAGERLLAKITVRTLVDRVLLSYPIQRSPGAPTMRIEQQLRLKWTPCHFGGERPWFVCSGHSPDQHCRRRVAKLYGGVRRFACRRCCGLAYESQRLTPRARAEKKAAGIRVRLGGSEDLQAQFPAKPKGMHWGTYEKLRAKAEIRNK